ncbi:TonB-dependent receptor [Maribellus maritimus]|uniref:TonB-dependent receptor n=1 Tax=Maribellus maritimus TaxID=2870838 RepID=UPI001EEBE43F|nr:carboxypeptidase-like regulatory domain-containing protein [Maribellus maritimus]MCG6188196.1 TonB-dependent receptor [Maribellus maritimus]
MKNFILILAFFTPLFINAQNKHTISGYVTDGSSDERLTGATIFNKTTGKGTVSNNYGFFSLTDMEGNCQLEIRFVGFKKKALVLYLEKDTFLNVSLQRGIEIEEIKVRGHEIKRSNPELSILSQPGITMQMIESAPVILGEHDILKTLQFMPGIKQGAENTASFNVRGGSADQNLILLDGVPVYNVNHLMGFFSVFNTDAVKDVVLIKGGIPARYGGRLSSVLDISMKEGNLNKNSGVFSISPVSGRFTYEGPIKQDKGAFIVSARRTFFDIPMAAIQKLNGEGGVYGYYFYDLNTKANWIFNPGSRLYLSLYTGKDNLFSNTRVGNDWKSRYRYNWGNITTVLRWNKVFSSKLFSNFSLYYSRFRHNELGKAKDKNTQTLFKTTSELQDISFKSDFDFYVSPQYTFRFGSKLSHLVFNPNIIQVKSTESDISFNNQNRTQAARADVYFENAFDLGKLKLNAGGRLSGYFTEGKNYFHIQPRFSAGFELFPHINISTSYTQMVQNIHLLTNSSFGMPTDLWVASTDKVGPQLAQQFTMGLSKQIRNEISFNIEGYYKRMHDVVRFDEGVAFLNPKESAWDRNVLVGEGRAYGMEFMTQKNSGRLTGMLSYTLSWSERKYVGLNNGNWFPFKYDRRHDVSFLAEYRFKESWKTTRSFSIGFTLQSGNNLSVADVEYEGLLTPGRELADYHYDWEVIRQTYDNPNNFKMPTFHHLDIGYSIVKQKTDSKSVTWSFSVYNVYNRMNPWYYYKSEGKVKQVSLFPIIPSVGFKYEF